MSLLSEIHQQPEVLQSILDTEIENTQRIAEAIRQKDIAYIFLAARGTSDYAGIYAQYVLGSFNQLSVAFAAPSLFTMYAEPPRLKHALVVGISQSGQSPDIVQVISEGRRQGAPTLAITNFTDSPLAQAADFTLNIHAGTEKAVAATKTYTAELLTIALFSAVLSGKEHEHLSSLRMVPKAVRQMLRQDAYIADIAKSHRDMRQCVVLGRGYNYATAWEWSLKLKELAYVLAHPYSTADFQHGPIAVLEQGFPVLAIAPSGATFPDLFPFLSSLKTEHAARLLVISDRAEALEVADDGIPLPIGLPEWLTPILSVVPAQLYCNYLAKAKGYDTEQPRSLQKVTLTR